MGPRIKFKIMLQGLTKEAGGATLDLRDAYIDWHWKEEFKIQFGQFFVNFDFENFAPSWALHTVDRSIINDNLGFERDIGIQFHGKLFSKRFRYYLYAMNGDGRNKLNNNDDLFLGARFDYSFLGTHQYQVADLNQSDSPHLALGLSILHDTGAVELNNNIINRFSSDLVFRFKGFSALGIVNSAHNNNLGKTDIGFLGELGYFIVPHKVEVVGRWAYINKDGAVGKGTVDPQEVGGGLNFYIYGHNLKIQDDYTRLINNESTQNQNDDRGRIQLQLFF